MLSQSHQKLLDQLHPDGYEIKTIKLQDGSLVDEHDFFHILFVKILRDGKRTRDVPMIQKFGTKDWKQFEDIVKNRKNPLGLGSTGQDEYGIIHDPIEWKKQQAAEAKKQEAAEAEKAKQEATALKAKEEKARADALAKEAEEKAAKSKETIEDEKHLAEEALKAKRAASAQKAKETRAAKKVEKEAAEKETA